MNKVIVRIKGGLGNQLFCYAAARRLALINKAELIIDDVSGFVRDIQYQRRYALDNFHIEAQKAAPGERLEPFERYRRGLIKFSAKLYPFSNRQYIEQEGFDFDSRLVDYRIKNNTVYLDGLWQSENYFFDVGDMIRQDLKVVPPEDQANQQMSKRILACNAVALHVRFFNKSDAASSWQNLHENYYTQAIEKISKKVNNPHFFIFSDNPKEAKIKTRLSTDIVTCVDINHGDENAYADLWLMTLCKHFIISNSTFSWWGAWLAEFNDPKPIIFAFDQFSSKDTVPNRWVCPPFK